LDEVWATGLLFISYQKDPQDFICLQNRLSVHDLLNEYIRHDGSAICAVPLWPNERHFIGQSVFS
jgi:deferrochelatase/peroxidase EfeB